MGFDARSDGGTGDGVVTGDGRGDGAGGDSGNLTSPITYVGPFAAVSGLIESSNTVNIQAQGAGHVVAMQVGCNTNTAPTAVTVTAPGWSFYSLEPGVPNGDGTYYTSEWVAITPDTTPTTMTITWSGTTCELDGIVLADEFANVKTSAGVSGVVSGGAKNSGASGNCAFSLPTVVDAETIWFACYSSQALGAPYPAWAKGADDAAGDLAGYRITTDPAGTVEMPGFAGPGHWIADAIELVPP